MLFKILKIITPLTLIRKIKHCKLAELGLKVNKKNQIFQHL
jgi:hypothetical protein